MADFLFIISIATLAVSISGLHVVADTVSDLKTLDITAVVGGPTPSGGGGSGTILQGTIVLSGFTFPSARITLLKDGFVATTLIANQDGTFQILINSLVFGNYQFSVYAEDLHGVQSAPYTVNAAVFSAQPQTYNNIIIPPTISSSSLLVQVGQQFSISGYATPGATISLEIPGSTALGTTVADTLGYYQISVRASLPSNTYQLRTKASFNGGSSPYSKPVQITVYTPPTPGSPGVPGTPTPPSQLSACVDYNQDRHVNLIDFSILLFWFSKPDPPNTIDCNGDRVVDIRDFSILMYFWTG